MTHPSSLDLEAFAIGEPLPAHLAGHVDECSACGAFLEQLRAVVSDGPTAKEADDAVARALARMTTTEASDLRNVSKRARAANDDVREPSLRCAVRDRLVDQLAPLESPQERRQEPKRRLWFLASSVVAPLAAAAAILLLTRSPAPPTTPSSGEPRAQTTYKIQMGAIPPGVGTEATSGAAEPDTQFKGGMQVAVVRDRGGDQARFSSTVRVKPGDRLRVEVALDHEQAILGAVLADDGSYLELMPQAVRGPGTHFSERSAKIDAAPTRGTILIGTPEAVARARATKNLEGVTTLRVELEAP